MPTLSAAVLDRVHEHWNDRHWIGRSCSGPSDVDARQILDLVGHPGMHWPYLTLVRSSTQPAVKEFTSAIPGYRQRGIDAERVRALAGEGYTLKFQRLEDFDDTVRADVAALQAHFGLATTAYAFVTPAESQGLSFHRDASHVVAVQLEGDKEWDIVRPAGAVDPNAGLEPDPHGEHITFTLTPGDLLYLPHGWPHRARTVSGRSTHLTFTIARPAPYALASDLLAADASASPETSPAANAAPRTADEVQAAAVRRLGL